MARRICTIVLACGLAGCASTGPRPGVQDVSVTDVAKSAEDTRLTDGLWAMLDPGCQKPDRVDTRAWPKCASPFWISRQSALVVQTRPGDHGGSPAASYRADVSLTPGDPLIAKVGTPRDGYVYLALARLDRDERGRIFGAVGAAFACRAGAPGPISLKPSAGGCELASSEDLHRAARESLRDEGGLTRVAWVASGAP